MSKAPTFDEKTCDFLRAALQPLWDQAPELRSIGLVLDWREGLNQAATPHLWLSSEGPVTPDRLEIVHAGMSQTHKLLALQTQLALRGIQALQLSLIDLLEKIHAEEEPVLEKAPQRV